MAYYNSLGRRTGNGVIQIIVIFGVVALGLAILVVLVGGTVSNVSGRTHDIAQDGADKYLRFMGIEGRALCVSVDNDGDGYVSCPYVTTKDGATHALECAGAMNLNTGCRPPKAIINSINNSGR